MIDHMMMPKKSYIFSAVYLLMIPLLNWAFSWAPVWELPGGGGWTPFAILPGLVLVLRDFAQREIGNKVLILLVVGTVLSYFLAAPEIALASGLAFLVSEFIDWAVYTLTKKPLSQRIFYSSLIAAPIDSVIFFVGADVVVPGILTVGSVLASVLSKLVAALFVAWLVSRREKNGSEAKIPSSENL